VHGNRVKHVLDHLVPNASKPTHSIFNVTREKLVGLLDEAWLKKGSPITGDPGAYLIDMGRVIGANGERFIKIIVKPGTNNVITAYPIFP
jgi:filamentous hemagglutinin